MKDLEKTLQTYFLDKAPKMPADIQKLFVNYGPYLVLIGTVLSALGLISAFGIFSWSNPWSMMPGAYGGSRYQLALAYGVASTVLNALALSGLFKKQMIGWRYLYYNVLLGAIYNAVTFNFIGLVIGTGLGLYIMFQIRNHYK